MAVKAISNPRVLNRGIMFPHSFIYSVFPCDLLQIRIPISNIAAASLMFIIEAVGYGVV